MRVVNRSSHPSSEVARVVRLGWSGRTRPRLGEPATPTVIVHRRVRHNDDREGWTPFDRRQPVDLWVEDSDRYPQPGNASSWQQELLMSAAHERFHYDHPDQACPNNRCERAAEARAVAASRRLAHA